MSSSKRKARELRKKGGSENTVATATEQKVKTMGVTKPKPMLLGEFEGRRHSGMIEEDLDSDHPIFIIESGLNGGGSVKILPIRFFVTLGENPQLIIKGWGEKGSIQIGNRLRLIDQLQRMNQKYIIVTSIRINGVYVDHISFDQQNNCEIEISILGSGEDLTFNQLLIFNNRVTRP